MATAIYLHPTRTCFEWHKRIIDSIGLDFVPTASVGETLKRMEANNVSLVMLSGSAGYPLDDAIFPIKARHGETKIVVLSSSQAPDRLPTHIDGWICVADHEDIVRDRLRHSLEQ
jgi:hypothetical protein